LQSINVIAVDRNLLDSIPSRRISTNGFRRKTEAVERSRDWCVGGILI
jgi:hypothetical protein